VNAAAPSPTPSEGLPQFDEYASTLGEVPPLDEYTAMTKAIEQVGLDIGRDHSAVVKAARDLRNLSLAGVDPDSDVWHVTRERLFDAVDRLPVVFDIGWPIADEETLARGIFTDGGAL